MYVDFSNVIVDSEFTNGKDRLRTAPSAHAFSFLEGTVEGPGMPKVIGKVGKAAVQAVDAFEYGWVRLFGSTKQQQDLSIRKRAHGNKRIALETGIGRILGTSKIRKLVLPSFADPIIKNFKKLDHLGLTRRTPWIPQVLPIQIFIIGNTAFLGMAAEITTIAGKRLSDRVLKILRQRKAGKIERIILCPYSNGYHGYITTPEEYDLQLYEGGHTVFGKWTLPAYLTKFKELAIQLQKPEAEREYDTKTQPDVFKDDEIWYGFDEEEETELIKTINAYYQKTQTFLRASLKKRFKTST